MHINLLIFIIIPGSVVTSTLAMEISSPSFSDHSANSFQVPSTARQAGHHGA